MYVCVSKNCKLKFLDSVIVRLYTFQDVIKRYEPQISPIEAIPALIDDGEDFIQMTALAAQSIHIIQFIPVSK